MVRYRIWESTPWTETPITMAQLRVSGRGQKPRQLDNIHILTIETWFPSVLLVKNQYFSLNHSRHATVWLKGPVCSDPVCGKPDHRLQGQIREVTDPVGMDVQKRTSGIYWFSFITTTFQTNLTYVHKSSRPHPPHIKKKAQTNLF